MKYHCNCCGDTFAISKEYQENIENGYAERPNKCEECDPGECYEDPNEYRGDNDGL